MADVENVSQAAPAATAPVQDVAGSLGTNGKKEGGVQSDDNATSNDLGTSPTQEKSSNSHPHDSEYDTASDLEGGEEYDDEEDDLDDDSLTDDDDDDESETDDDDEEEDEEGEMTPQEKVDAEAQKKVDEDRSNPQYIPKRGTFYEHDDRTAEADSECIEIEGPEDVEGQAVANGPSGSTAVGAKSSSTTTISSASKTMKKWQPASGVDRWSHDRFDPSEQAPKSRTELVSAYGYDIRTEDAPPKARRRRRYGRGPSKYNRNWEDESAYLKTNNKERKPPKPSDFPALNENSSKPRRSSGRTREEKENRMERRQREGKSERSDRQGHNQRSNFQDDYNDRRGERNNDSGSSSHKNMKSKTNFNRQNQATVGRQAAMEFKQKNRQANQGSSHQSGQGSNLSNRLEAHRQPNAMQNQYPSQQSNRSPPTSGGATGKQQNQNTPQQQQNDNYNTSKKKSYDQAAQGSPQTAQQQQSTAVNLTVVRQQQTQQNTQPQAKPQMPTSNLSQRLQQVQNRNDPSHVGSVQMHALASQNQQQQQQQLMQQQHQQTANMMMTAPPQTTLNQAPQEQRGPPKRYSSLRRSQHEAQHIAEHQQLQLQHMQQQQAAAAAPPAILMPAEQAMLQANLMQMYHQENMQAQMQALQVSQQPNVPKQPAYAPPGPQAQPPGPYPGAATTPAYYVAPDAYTAAATAQATQAAASYAAQQTAPNYMTQQQTAATLAYAQPTPAPQQAAPASAFGAAPNVGVVSQANPAASSAANYQNYNTVGGTTYFVPPPTQTSNRPVSLPQRRPTNAIPILPPSEKNKPQSGQQNKTNETKDDAKSTSANQNVSAAPIGSAENIDHIIDNMFVQRPVFQPPATNSGPSATSKSQIASNDQSTVTSSASTTADNSNSVNPGSVVSSQDNSNNTSLSSEKLTNEVAATSEISNNNPISTQE